MTRAERKLSHLSSTASFRSATSYASFRSFKSIMSNKSLNSFKSFVSNQDDVSHYFSCTDNASIHTNGIVNEGFQDSLSYYSIDDADLPSIAAVAPNPRQRSVSSCGETPQILNAKTVDSEEKEQSKTHKLLAYLAVSMAAIAVAGSASVISMVPTLSTWVLLVYRSILQLLIALPLLLGTKTNVLGPPGFRWRLYFTGLLSGVLLLALYLSISILPPQVVAPIFMTTPVVTVFLSRIILREHLGLYRALTMCLLVAGILFLSRPFSIFPFDPSMKLQESFAQFNLYGFPANFNKESSSGGYNEKINILGLISAIFTPFLGALLIITSRQCKEVHFSVMLFWSAMGCLLIGCIGLYTIDTNVGREASHGSHQESFKVVNETSNGDNITRIRMFEGSTEWLVATLVSFLGVLVNVLVVKALQLIPPGKMLLLKTSELIVGYILYLCISTKNSGDSQHWFDVSGVVCMSLVVVFAIFEDFVVDVTRWRWF